MTIVMLRDATYLPDLLGAGCAITRRVVSDLSGLRSVAVFLPHPYSSIKKGGRGTDIDSCRSSD